LSQIAGDGKNPGRGAGAIGVEISRLAPHREQGLLRQIFGRIGRSTEPRQHRLDPRRVEFEQRRERGAVLFLGNRPDPVRRIVSGRGPPITQHGGSALDQSGVRPGNFGPKCCAFHMHTRGYDRRAPLDQSPAI
jgi:hypothetical protein